jgi:hypothetical protein
MPFNLFKRSEPTPPPKAAQPSGAIAAGEIAFEGITEDWHLVGTIQLEGRLSDVLNRREKVPIAGVYWAPIDGSEPFTAAPGLKEVDPYDLLVIFTGKDSLPPRDDETERAMRIRKITYDVVIDLGLLEVAGRVYLHPGTQPGSLMERHAELFVPITQATAFLGERAVGNENADVLLINQSYIRRVNTIEREAADLAREAAMAGTAGTGTGGPPETVEPSPEESGPGMTAEEGGAGSDAAPGGAPEVAPPGG